MTTNHCKKTRSKIETKVKVSLYFDIIKTDASRIMTLKVTRSLSSVGLSGELDNESNVKKERQQAPGQTKQQPNVKIELKPASTNATCACISVDIVNSLARH